MTGAIGSWLAEVYLLSTIVLLALGVAMRALRQPARRVFVAWCGAVGLVGLVGVSTWSNYASVADSPTNHHKAAPPTLSSIDPDFPAMGCAVPPSTSFLATGCSDGTPSPPARSAALPESRPIPSGVVLAFLIGSGLATSWLFVGSRLAARLLGKTAEAPWELRARLSAVVGTGRRAPRLRIAQGVGQPFVIGAFRPTIVLPTRFTGDEEPEGRVEAALRHEWAHIRHGDLALLALLRGLLPVLFAHPAYWWLRRRIRADQEAMADALAVRDGDRLGYAEALLTWARAAPAGSGRSHSGALALWERPGELRERVALLLSPPFPLETRCPLAWRMLVVSTAVVVGLSLAGLSIAGAKASTAAAPHACDDCEQHAPPPMLTVFCCPPDAVAASPVESPRFIPISNRHSEEHRP